MPDVIESAGQIGQQPADGDGNPNPGDPHRRQRGEQISSATRVPREITVSTTDMPGLPTAR